MHWSSTIHTPTYGMLEWHVLYSCSQHALEDLGEGKEGWKVFLLDSFNGQFRGKEKIDSRKHSAPEIKEQKER